MNNVKREEIEEFFNGKFLNSLLRKGNNEDENECCEILLEAIEMVKNKDEITNLVNARKRTALGLYDIYAKNPLLKNDIQKVRDIASIVYKDALLMGVEGLNKLSGIEMLELMDKQYDTDFMGKNGVINALISTPQSLYNENNVTLNPRNLETAFELILKSRIEEELKQPENQNKTSYEQETFRRSRQDNMLHLYRRAVKRIFENKNQMSDSKVNRAWVASVKAIFEDDISVEKRYELIDFDESITQKVRNKLGSRILYNDGKLNTVDKDKVIKNILELADYAIDKNNYKIVIVLIELNDILSSRGLDLINPNNGLKDKLVKFLNKNLNVSPTLNVTINTSKLKELMEEDQKAEKSRDVLNKMVDGENILDIEDVNFRSFKFSGIKFINLFKGNKFAPTSILNASSLNLRFLKEGSSLILLVKDKNVQEFTTHDINHLLAHMVELYNGKRISDNTFSEVAQELELKLREISLKIDFRKKDISEEKTIGTKKKI